jgi:hypothetical protein
VLDAATDQAIAACGGDAREAVKALMVSNEFLESKVCELQAVSQACARRSETEASIPLDAIRRPRDTPIWKLEAALKCRSCRKRRYVHMIKLTERQEFTPYKWVHPDENERR